MACLLTYHSENCMLSSCVGLPDSCCRISRPDTARPGFPARTTFLACHPGPELVEIAAKVALTGQVDLAPSCACTALVRRLAWAACGMRNATRSLTTSARACSGEVE